MYTASSVSFKNEGGGYVKTQKYYVNQSWSIQGKGCCLNGHFKGTLLK